MEKIIGNPSVLTKASCNRDVDNTGSNSVATSIKRVSTQSITTESPNTERLPIKRKKTEAKHLEDQNESLTCSMDGDTGIPVPSADRVPIESAESIVPKTLLSALTNYPLLKRFFLELIDNPLIILVQPEFYIRKFRNHMHQTSFELQNEILTSLLDFVQKQKDTPDYCETYHYANLWRYEGGFELDKSCLSKTKYDQLVFLIKTQIDAIEAEKTLIQEMRQNKAFNDFDDLWKLVINHKDQTHGKYSYENEAGYLKGYFAGLTFVLEQVGKNNFIPNWETLHKLHHIMTDKVEDDLHIPIRARIKRDQDIGMCIIYPTKEYDEQLKKTGNISESTLSPGDTLIECKYYQVHTKCEEEINTYISRKNSCNTVKKEVESVKKLFDEYSEKLITAKTEEEKELAIIFYVTNLERMHLFLDGNLRSITVLWTGIRLMNKLDLMILYDPNDLDDHSDQQLFILVKRGIVNFKSLLKSDSSKYQAWNLNLNEKFDRIRKPSLCHMQ